MSGQKKSWDYFVKTVFSSEVNCLKILEDWEKHSLLTFTPQSYSHLLQLSLCKNYHELSIHLLNKKEIIYPFIIFNTQENKITKSKLVDNLMTNNLYEKDHAAWIGLMSFHHPFHLLGFNWDYHEQKYFPVASAFFNHPTFKPLFMNKQRQNIILEHCHAKSKEMIRSIFLDLDLPTKTYKIESKPVKI